MKPRASFSVTAFTLAELLIAMLILGVISTFTIPKVLMAQQNGQYKAIAKEALSMVAGAYSAYKMNNTPTSATTFANMTPFLNYVRIDTTSQIDNNYWAVGPVDCSDAYCMRLHNGAVLWFDEAPFGGTATTNMVIVSIDPDGKVTQATSPANAPGKALDIFLYYNGRMTTYGECIAGSTTGWWAPTCPNSNPGPDPTWFSWN